MAMYKVGWFYDSTKEPVLPNIIPLQKSVTNILDFLKKLNPKLTLYQKKDLF
jgi:hypothetical protein